MAAAKGEKKAKLVKPKKLVKSSESRDPAIRVILLPRDTNKHGTILAA